ncbi:MAG: hypothetical protein IKH56_07575 [Oscillospiraceae bacterium]|nr:hypothetical protein [Oscillospiraceae bacterium]
MEIFARPRGDLSPHEAVRALLADAVTWYAGISLPAVAKTERGKPFFPDHPDLCFSLSHSGALVLCAVGRRPCGADVQEPRILSERLLRRCFDPRELAAADPLALWCLKESFIKLNGRMDRPLRDMVFLPSGDVFEGPDGAVGRVWQLAGGHAAALVCRGADGLPSAVRYPFAPENTG